MGYKALARWIAAGVVLSATITGANAQDVDYESAFAARVAQPGDALVLGQFLSIAIQNGQYDQAISTIEQHLIDHPRDAQARLILARLYYHVGSYELAARHLGHAISIGTLSAEELADAQALAQDVEERLQGIAMMLFLTGGVRAVSTDYVTDFYDDRIETNPFGRLGGQVVIDLMTPTNDSLTLEGSLGVTRRFGDFDLSGDGTIYTAIMGDFAITLSKGLPGITPTLREDFAIYGDFETFDDGIVRQEYGVSKRLSVRPSAESQLFVEGALGWLGASTDILGEYRGHLEAGGVVRLDNGARAGVAARGFVDFDSLWAPIGHTGEVEVSYANELMTEPDKYVWSHRLSAAIGVLSVPDILMIEPNFEGYYWRAAWDHAITFENGHRVNLGVSYRDTTFTSEPDRSTRVLAGSASYTVVID